MRIYTTKPTTCGHLPCHGRNLCASCYKRDYRDRNRAALAAYNADYRETHRSTIRISGRAYAREWRITNQTPTRKSWQRMIERCGRPKNIGWKYYGGRGITVCKRWNPKTGGTFANFLADMGERPEGKTLDRRDNDGDYTPENCRWATPQEQRANRRR